MNDALRARLIGGFAGILMVLCLGSIGFFLLGDGRWGIVDCVYMTTITVTTVGFGETLPGFDEVRYAREFTVLLIVFGMGSFIYFASNLTAVIIEGDLRDAIRRTRMRKSIQKLEDHVVVCGAGSTGRHVIEELISTDTPVVAVDTDEECLVAIENHFPKSKFLYVVGDATEDEVLEAANVSRARGVVAALHSDKDNLYLVVTCRQANPGARIVARGSDLKVLEKLRRAGADTVVSPNFIGGMRMVSELIRPEVVRFLDVMLRDQGNVRIDEVEVPKGSRYAGTSLRDSHIREDTQLSVVAARAKGDGYVYSPGGDFQIREGMTLVVLGEVANVAKLRKLARS